MHLYPSTTGVRSSGRDNTFVILLSCTGLLSWYCFFRIWLSTYKTERKVPHHDKHTIVHFISISPADAETGTATKGHDTTRSMFRFRSTQTVCVTLCGCDVDGRLTWVRMDCRVYKYRLVGGGIGGDLTGCLFSGNEILGVRWEIILLCLKCI